MLSPGEVPKIELWAHSGQNLFYRVPSIVIFHGSSLKFYGKKVRVEYSTLITLIEGRFSMTHRYVNQLHGWRQVLFFEATLSPSAWLSKLKLSSVFLMTLDEKLISSFWQWRRRRRRRRRHRRQRYNRSLSSNMIFDATKDENRRSTLGDASRFVQRWRRKKRLHRKNDKLIEFLFCDSWWCLNWAISEPESEEPRCLAAFKVVQVPSYVVGCCKNAKSEIALTKRKSNNELLIDNI